MELNLRFPDPAHVVVRLDDDESAALPFQNPLTEQDRQDIAWYIETYARQPLEHDQAQAERIQDRLPAIGQALFQAVFQESEARRRFNRLQDHPEQPKLITLSADDAGILSLPWELLHEPDAPVGTHLFHEHISLHRRYAGASKGRGVVAFRPKPRLRLLLMVSRPEGAGFIDPRADAGAVLNALDGQDGVDVEFLRPASLDALLARLGQDPPVDILHFDGHGVFDEQGGILAAAASGGSPSFRDASDGQPNTGYLLFEDGDGNQDLISAATLGANLHRHPVGLVILSACQSAALGTVEPLGSVAARLTAAGLPAVLAMTHSVLVKTTETLFGQLYRHLADGKPLGAALSLARRHLANHPEKHHYWQGEQRLKLKLYDWFIPALYQAGPDGPLLATASFRQGTPESSHKDVNLSAATASEANSKQTGQSPSLALDSGVPAGMTCLPPRPEAGFYGRSRELWNIERWFAHPQHPARRISLAGFGGQGKTALALEAGRWLLRTGLFRAAAFVNYAAIPSRDAVAVAVAELAAALGLSLSDAHQATQALKQTPTLLILDNLEALDAETLRELLDAAHTWSEAGPSRVLLTSRQPDFRHAAYRLANTWAHRRILLDGLGEEDALDWHDQLRQLPPPPQTPEPNRRGLLRLFAQVRYHPLSIRVLAAQLKTRRLGELGERLETLLKPLSPRDRGWGEGGDEDLPAHLLASLRLSLERLDPAARASLAALGVLQGGALENMLTDITGIAESAWQTLRPALENAALLEAESLDGISVPFLRFHPTLAPLLWLELDAAAQTRLSAAHRARYYALAGWLYQKDSRNPHAVRTIARRELPNLLHAVRAALAAADPQAVDFADSVNRFLDAFGLRREQAELSRLAQQQAQDTGSRAWYLAQSNRGEQLRAAGRANEAAAVFQALLARLGETASYERAQTLGLLGRCFRSAGRPELAAQSQQQALAVLDTLEPNDGVKRQCGVCLTDLADALVQLGDHAQARQRYQQGLAIAEEQNDTRSQGVILGQLGTLALAENQSELALQHYQQALGLFQQLQEPATEAIAWHQLGLVYQQTRQWEPAERCYRESARIKESLGHRSGAAATWNQLAIVNENAGKPEAAEVWYRKAMQQHRDDEDALHLAGTLNNLADLLSQQAQRLGEALSLAEEALALKQTLESGAAEIWTTYDILANIAEQQAKAGVQPAERRQQARAYRQQAQQAYRVFPGNRVFLQQFAPLIQTACAALAPARRTWLQRLTRKTAADPAAVAALAEIQAALRLAGPDWAKLADALDRLQAGQRDGLLDGLRFDVALILHTILQGLDDPARLAALSDPAA